MTGRLTIKNGTYYMILNLKDESGRTRPKWITTRLPERGNKRRAEEMLQEKLMEYGRQEAVFTSILFSDFLLEWLETMKHNVQQNTLESYYAQMNAREIPYFSRRRIKLADLQPRQLQAFYLHLQDLGLSANTVIKHHTNIHKALDYAVRMNLIPYNPSERVVLPKRQKYMASYYDAEQVQALLERIKGEDIYPCVFLAAFYGLRRSEVLGLQWGDIDFKNNVITICHTVVQFSTIQEKNRTKTESSHRTLPLVPEVADYLHKLKKEQAENRLLLGSGYHVSDYVCRRPDGSLIKPQSLTERFSTLIKKHSLPKIRFHDLRHSAASMLLAAGYSLHEITEWLGHSAIATTSHIYAHLQHKAKGCMS
ncbi:MAG: site-specific integrase, partial [Clostridiales bacterium]|nr:site-specific integrase [Clostridiales bacterium]